MKPIDKVEVCTCDNGTVRSDYLTRARKREEDRKRSEKKLVL